MSVAVVEDAKLQHSSSVRERDDMALRTLKRTPKLYDVTQRVTANDSAACSRANRAVVTTSALCRTTLAPEKYDRPSILLDTAQRCINKGRKHLDASTIATNCGRSEEHTSELQ